LPIGTPFLLNLRLFCIIGKYEVYKTLMYKIFITKAPNFLVGASYTIQEENYFFSVRFNFLLIPWRNRGTSN